MSSLDFKIDRANGVIVKLLGVYKNPIVMSSFGKDSMVMLSLLEKLGHRLPILFHRIEAFFPKKYEFANKVITEKNYTVYDYPPSGTSIIKSGAVIDVLNWYPVGSKFLATPTGVESPLPDEPFLCGLRDVYRKPVGQGFTFPWDLAFVGHKDSDRTPLYGSIPLTVDLKQNVGAADYAFPLRHFTDADIWEYHRVFKLPLHTERYDPELGFAERPDHSSNPDYFPVCTRCMDREGPKTVHCPLIKETISNISSELMYTEPERPQHVAPATSTETIQ
jgi:Phosphoadenosine phosphosulfate reductase family